MFVKICDAPKMDSLKFGAWLGKVEQTEQQFLLRGEKYTDQCVLLPHEIVASMYKHPKVFFPLLVGEPGRLEKYWAENIDLYESLKMPDLDTWIFLKTF